ncbi:MAG TPA: FAD:protein FMN transferase [Candidatus Dormibacteraeota bacterium]|nr:FAD:protein FMN transferase [Candidatus Dormibacteraeota bacterium]
MSERRTAVAIADDRAFGGTLRLIVTHEPDLAAAKSVVNDVVRAVDLAANRFHEDSELSRLNATPGRDVVVSPLLTRLIAAALRGARLTGGAVDPTVGSAVKLAGYGSDFAAVPADGVAIDLVVSRIPGWQAIVFDEAARTVRLPRGVDLDLGATAKAITSDLAAAAALSAVSHGGVLVSLGGDISVAGDPPAEGWLIQASEDSNAPIQESEETISLTSGGIATSSTTVRRWTRGGVALHHIIDPTTGLPSDGPWRTATVVAGTCVDANIASTAAIVMGQAAVQWLESARLPARLVDRSGTVHRLAGWPKPS